MATRRKITKDRCTICSHPERLRIETLRLGGMTGETIAEMFGLSSSAVYRHMSAHVEPDIKAQIIADVPLSELLARATDEGMSLLDYLKVVRNTCITTMLAASSVGDFGGTASTAKRSLETLREIGRLTGELLNAAPVRNYVQTNITIGEPAMARLEDMLLDRLKPYPEALQAVLAGLRTLDAPSAPMIDVTPQGASHAA